MAVAKRYNPLEREFLLCPGVIPPKPNPFNPVADLLEGGEAWDDYLSVLHRLSLAEKNQGGDNVNPR